MKTKRPFQRVERMTPTMRVIHWVNVVAVVAAVVTGLYIAHPYYQTFMADPAVDKYVMAWNRLVHLFAAITVDITSIWIAYMYASGDRHKPWMKLIPSKNNAVEFFEVVLNIFTFNRRKKFDTTHMDSFNAFWFALLHLLLVFMLLTGLQMYVQGLASGESSIGTWWPWILHVSTDWTLSVFGGNMGVRYVHHLGMWAIVIWTMFHIYVQIWRTIFWQEGDIAIAFGGSKFPKKRREES